MKNSRKKKNNINETKYNNAIIIIGAGPGKSKVGLQIGAHKRTLSKKEVVKTLSISIIIRINPRAKFTKTENGYQTRTDTWVDASQETKR